MQKIILFFMFVLLCGTTLQASTQEMPPFVEGYVDGHSVFSGLFDATHELPPIAYKNMELDPKENHRIFPVFAGETKIVKKSAGVYIFTPGVHFGHVLVAETRNFIGVGHFIETVEQKLPLFINSLNEKEPIQFVTLAGSFGSMVTEPIALTLSNAKIPYKHVDLPAILCAGALKDGLRQETGPIIAISQYLGDGKPITTQERQIEVIKKCPYPRDFAVDCADGRFLNLGHVYDVSMPLGPNIRASTSLLSIFQYASVQFLMHKKYLGEITSDEVQALMSRYKLAGM